MAKFSINLLNRYCEHIVSPRVSKQSRSAFDATI